MTTTQLGPGDEATWGPYIPGNIGDPREPEEPPRCDICGEYLTPDNTSYETDLQERRGLQICELCLETARDLTRFWY